MRLPKRLPQRVHLNHAGASLPSPQVMTAILDHLRAEQVCGPMEAAAAAAGRLDEARNAMAGLIGAASSEVAFAGSNSIAWGEVFSALPVLHAGDRILVGRQEWGGNLATLKAAADRANANIEVIPVHEDQSVDAMALSHMIDSRVRLISLTWLPANGGLINDAAAVGRVARAAGIPYIVDASQAIGQLPVNVDQISCDILTAPGRKYLRGPRGTAFLYVRRGFLDRLTPAFLDVAAGPWRDGGPQVREDARRFEPAELPVGLFLGLGEAAKLAQDIGIESIRTRIAHLSSQLREQLSGISGVSIHDLGTERSGLVSFTVQGIPAQKVRSILATQEINIGANGTAYTPLDMESRGLEEVARASVNHLNTEEEIDRLCHEVSLLTAKTT